jgi:DoxX-like family
MIKRKPATISIWTGRILSALVVVILLADAAVNLFAPQLLKAEMAAVGFPVELAPVLAMLMLLCAAAYAYPRTSVLGAILVTGFFGGAICLHLRIGEIGSPPQFVCLVIGLMAWAGLFLQDANVRAILPVRRLA